MKHKKTIEDIEEELTEWIEDHIVIRPAGKFIRIVPFEWDEFKKRVFGEDDK